MGCGRAGRGIAQEYLRSRRPSQAVVVELMARFLNRKSQRRYRLKFANSYYGELSHYGLYRLDGRKLPDGGFDRRKKK